MADAIAGDWVQVHGIVLRGGERAPQTPADTAAAPLEIWVKGYLQADAHIGDVVVVETVTGRAVSGRLTARLPQYDIGFGGCRPELLRIGRQLRKIMAGEGREK